MEMNKNHIKDYKDLIVKKFGRLFVVKRDSKDKRHPHLICNCECGKQVSVNAKHLLLGKTKSCGCMRIEKTFVEGTSMNMIKSKIRADNINGEKEVRKYKNK